MQSCFVLGLGAQKAGTSWLHHYLSGYECADFGLFKEYHVWDAKFFPRLSGFRAARGGPFPSVAGATSPKELLRRAMQSADGFYEDYFARLIQGPVRITGDITPSYALLTRSQLAFIRGRLAAKGFTVKVVFLMRDPVERCWSAARAQVKPLAGEASATAEEDCLRRLYRSQQFVLRTAYDRTIAEIEAVIPSADVHYAISEELSTAACLTALSEFLGLEPHAARGGIRVKTSPARFVLDPQLRCEIAAYYADVYEFCRRRFPQTEALWLANPGAKAES